MAFESISDLMTFARVVDAGGFTAAARQMGITTSAASRSVTRLERQLGLRLLNRTTRSLTPTDAGRQIVARCAVLADTLREVQALAGEHVATPMGHLRVSAPVVLGQVWLVPRLPAFLGQWPGVKLDLVLEDRQVDLVEEGIDVAIRIASALPEGVVARHLFDMRYVIVASPRYLRGRKVTAQAASLAALDWIHLAYGPFGNQLDLEAKSRRRLTVQMAARVTVSNTQAMLELVKAGVGVGVMPEFTAAKALEQGDVVQLLADWQLGGAYSPRPVSAVHASNRFVPKKVRTFIDHLTLP